MARQSQGTRLIQRQGKWYITWTECGRSYRRSTGTGNRKEAETVLAAFIQERDRPSSAEGALPVEVALADYIDEHAKKKCAAPERIEYAAKPLSEFFYGAAVSSIAQADVAAYCEWRGVSDGTLRRELNVLVAAINHAVRAKRLSAADVPYIPLPSEPPGKDRWLRREEAHKLLEAASYAIARGDGGRFERGAAGSLTRCYLFTMIALHTAARKRSIETLTWFQVDLTKKRINFNPAGRKQTKKRRPVVPISDELLTVLKQAHAQAESEYVLGHPGAIRSTFESAALRAGLEDVTPHTLRHTWATWAAQAGRPLWDIAGVLGDTLSTVEKKYAHHHPDYLRETVNFRRAEG